MNDFRYAQMEWLHAIWLVLALAFTLAALELRRRTVLDRFVSLTMQSRLVRSPSLRMRLLEVLLISASLIALVLAMMRPQWGSKVQSVTRIDSQIMICLDVSKSMLAEDVVPNRLERAKAEINSMLDLMQGGEQVGLIAFAGKAIIQCPMTTDYGFLRLVLQEASPRSIGLGGTRIGEALQKGVDGFRLAGDVNRLILLITDGEDHDSFPLDAAKRAREHGIRVVSIGIGDEGGTKIEITDPKTGGRTYLQGPDGQDVISRLDGETLREIALETEGAYIPAGTGMLDLQSIYQSHIATMLEGTADTTPRILRNEAYQGPVLLGILLLLMGLLIRNFSTKEPRIDSELNRGAAPGTVELRSVLLALFFLGVVSASPEIVSGQPVSAQSASPQNVSPQSTTAQSTAKSTNGTQNHLATSPPETVSEPSIIPESEELTPRETYNRAIPSIDRQFDQAQKLLEKARQEAGVDGELRFRCLYNLGWVEINRSDALLEENPQQALAHLKQAAHRFREAIRMRPKDHDARHNLEVVSRKILTLVDSLREQETNDFKTRLEALIQQQRQQQIALRNMAETEETTSPESKKGREAFRRCAIAQRRINSDLQKLIEDSRMEVQSLQAKPDNEKNDQDRMRAAQLGAMQGPLEKSVQLANKAHSMTRRKQANRAFLRWSASLSFTKRGLDQLRNPVEVLGIVHRDASELANLTARLDRPGKDATQEKSAPPTWLSQEFLEQSQTSINERMAELISLLSSMLSHGEAPEESQQESEPPTPEVRRLLDSITDALPPLKQAAGFFEQAHSAIQASDFQQGTNRQTDALIKLAEAAEFFYDIRRLIETMYHQELLIQQNLPNPGESPDEELRQTFIRRQQKNLDRSPRLEGLLIAELDRLKMASSQKPEQEKTNPPQENTDQEKQRYEAAIAILKQASKAMAQVQSELKTPTTQLPLDTEPSTDAVHEEANQEAIDLDTVSAPDKNSATIADTKTDSVAEVQTEEDKDADVGKGTSDAADPIHEPSAVEPKLTDPIQEPLQQAITNLADLRRLFFSIVEHLRETTQRQMSLNDETNALAHEKNRSQTGPLGNRQLQLAQIAQQIGESLQQQSQQPVPENSAPEVKKPPSTSNAKNLKEAAQWVQQASESMSQVAESLKGESTESGSAESGPTKTGTPAKEATQEVDFQTITEGQQSAVENLQRALAILDSRPPDSEPQSPDEKQQEQEQPSDSNPSPSSKGQPEPTGQSPASSQILQQIRDREAQRRKDRAKSKVSPRGTTDKDW